MGSKISKGTQHELIQALRERYTGASKDKKTKILDEFIDISGGHRKYAICLLSRDESIVPVIPKPSALSQVSLGVGRFSELEDTAWHKEVCHGKEVYRSAHG
jgi:hypothetical protein